MMTWLRCLADEKSFVSSTSLLEEAYPEHDEAISGDSLFSIQLNHKWRRIIAGLLSEKFRRDDSTISLDNEDLLNNLLLDLYDAEALNVATTTRHLHKNIGAVRSTTSTSRNSVSGASFAHTPTYANMLITCSNIPVFNTKGNTVRLSIKYNGNDAATLEEIDVTGFETRLVTVSAKFTGVGTGVSNSIELFWRVDAGEGIMRQDILLHWDIIEYD